MKEENQKNKIVSPVVTQLQTQTHQQDTIVSAVPTQLQNSTEQSDSFFEKIQSKVSWTNNLEILLSTKQAREKVFYLSTGVLLCKSKDDTVIEYARARNLSPAVIADYATKLPDKKLLKAKLDEFAQLIEQTENK